MFSVDNDMLIPTNYMDFAFDTWRLFPYNLVGFAIRTARRSQEAPQVGMYEIWWTQYANNRRVYQLKDGWCGVVLDRCRLVLPLRICTLARTLQSCGFRASCRCKRGCIHAVSVRARFCYTYRSGACATGQGAWLRESRVQLGVYQRGDLPPRALK